MSDNNTIPPITRLLKRAAMELWDGCYVNLGIGLPGQVLSLIDPTITTFIHSENGVLGAGQQAPREDMNPMLIDAGGAYVSAVSGACYFDSATSFGMVRNQRLDMCMLGAFEVDACGNLANWKIPGKFIPGIGGAMELAQSTKRLIVLTTHQDKFGASKIKKICSLPLTAKNCVDRIISDCAVIDVLENGLLVREMAEGLSQNQLRDMTEAELQFADEMQVF